MNNVNNRDTIENALTDIDERFVTEALTVNKDSKKKIFVWGGTLSRVAVACLAVVGIAAIGITSYAAVQKLQSAKIKDNTVYVGHEPDNTPPNVIVENIEETVKSTEVPTADSLWIKKELVEYGDTEYTYFYYNSYDDAATDHDMEKWFSNNPGAPDSIKVIFRDDDCFVYTRIVASYKYKDGEYLLDQLRMTCKENGSISNDFGMSIEYDETSNIREYTNTSGVTFTLVDGTNYDAETNEPSTETSVLILYDNPDNLPGTEAYKYSGYLFFDNLTDKEIHEVLDSFKS